MRDDDGSWDDDPSHTNIVRITAKEIAFPVWDQEHGGFGQIVVHLDPGEQETVMVGKRMITVIRDRLH